MRDKIANTGRGPSADNLQMAPVKPALEPSEPRKMVAPVAPTAPRRHFIAPPTNESRQLKERKAARLAALRPMLQLRDVDITLHEAAPLTAYELHVRHQSRNVRAKTTQTHDDDNDVGIQTDEIEKSDQAGQFPEDTAASGASGMSASDGAKTAALLSANVGRLRKFIKSAGQARAGAPLGAGGVHVVPPRAMLSPAVPSPRPCRSALADACSESLVQDPPGSAGILRDPLGPDGEAIARLALPLSLGSCGPLPLVCPLPAGSLSLSLLPRRGSSCPLRTFGAAPLLPSSLPYMAGRRGARVREHVPYLAVSPPHPCLIWQVIETLLSENTSGHSDGFVTANRCARAVPR